MTWILGLLKDWKVIAVGITIFVFVAMFSYMNWEIGHTKKLLSEARDANAVLMQSLSDAVKVNADNERFHQSQIAQLSHARDVAQAELAAQQARNVRLTETISAIRASPPSARSPISPVVRDTVDRLWPVQPEH